MSFLVDLANTECWRQLGLNQQDFTEQLTALIPYVVEDIFPKERMSSNLVLLLESPHRMEVCEGHPLAGGTGLEVTDGLSEVLLLSDGDRLCPFGKILKAAHTAQTRRLTNIGIMNVSQLPMQREVYLMPVDSSFDKLFKSLKTIRDGPAAKKRKDCLTHEVERLLLRDLRARILRTSSETCFVCCGDVARELYCKAVKRTCTQSFIERPCKDVPHPARGAWRESQSVNALKFEIRRCLG